MRFTFDPAKNEKNIAGRGLSFELAAELDWEAALIVEDTRHEYGELRLRVLALLDGRLHAVVVTPRKDTSHYQLQESQPERGKTV